MHHTLQVCPLYITHIHPALWHVRMIYIWSNSCNLMQHTCVCVCVRVCVCVGHNHCVCVCCRSRVCGWSRWQFLWVPAEGLAHVWQDWWGRKEDVLWSPSGNTHTAANKHTTTHSQTRNVFSKHWGDFDSIQIISESFSVICQAKVSNSCWY